MPRSSVQVWKWGPAIALFAKAELSKGYQSKLALKMGVRSMAVNQHFSGQHPMSEATVHKIATALDVPYDDLIVQALDLLAEEEEEEEETAPRSAIARTTALAPPLKAKASGKTKAAKSVRQPAQSTKDEVEAAPAKVAPKPAAKKGGGGRRLHRTG